jgi:hypothetical protein
MVRDRGTKESFDPARKLHAAIKSRAMANGLMVYPMGGTIDGQRGDHILLAPPYIVTDNDLHEIVSRLYDSINAALAFGVFGIPETFFIAPDGIVAGRHIGPIDEATLVAGIEAIRPSAKAGP